MTLYSFNTFKIDKNLLFFFEEKENTNGNSSLPVCRRKKNMGYEMQVLKWETSHVSTPSLIATTAIEVLLG